MALKVYFDTSALKRGWDDPRQLRVKLEAEAVDSLLQLVRRGALVFVRSVVHDLENARNTNVNRRAAVEELLDTFPSAFMDPVELAVRAARAGRAGIKGYDAVHLAAASMLGADVLVTTDDLLAARAPKAGLRIRVTGPIQLATEVLK
jgi:predicted nucleic acid-binding protein